MVNDGILYSTIRNRRAKKGKGEERGKEDECGKETKIEDQSTLFIMQRRLIHQSIYLTFPLKLLFKVCSGVESFFSTKYYSSFISLIVIPSFLIFHLCFLKVGDEEMKDSRERSFSIYLMT